MESIIRVIKGTDQGSTATLLQGQTVIGRGAKAGLKLTAPTVSWEHAVISRNLEDYYVENLSAHGSWVNDTKVSGRVKLRPRDVLKLSDEAVIRFEPAGMPQGLMARRNLLMAAIAFMVLVGGGLAIFNPFAAPPTPPADWNRTYSILSQWINGKVQDGRLPATTGRLFDTAWRLYRAEDFRTSRDLWLKMQFLLDSLEGRIRFNEFSADHPNELDKLNTALAGSDLLSPTDAEAAAATVQFVRRCLDASAKKSQSSGIGM